jgi:hypothetical protein
MSQNLSDLLTNDLNDLRDKYSSLLMQNSDFIGCLEIFKQSVILDLINSTEEDEE